MLLEFEHVTGMNKKFHLQDINFSLPPGYIMGLAGKNGAGKTTLISYIQDSDINYTGTIKVNGADIRENKIMLRNQIGFVSDENKFFQEYSAKQNAEMLGMLYENWDMELFYKSMDKMQVNVRRRVGSMSRGEQMKFQMAFAMSHKPVLYLLDEVTAGMDPVFRIDFFKILHDIIETEEASVLMTSHIQSEIGQKMDFVGILEAGKLIQFGESMDFR